MSHATSAASSRHRHSTGPPGSGQRQYEWIEAQQGMSRENYSPSIDSRIESLRSGHGSSRSSTPRPHMHHSGEGGSQPGSHSRLGSAPAPSSSPSGSKSEPPNSGSHHSASGPHGQGLESGSHHSSRSHRDNSESHQGTSSRRHHRSGSQYSNTSSSLMHEPSELGSGTTHEPREREHRDRERHGPRRNKYREEIENNPNQGPVSPHIMALSLAICHSLGKRPEEKRRKK